MVAVLRKRECDQDVRVEQAHHGRQCSARNAWTSSTLMGRPSRTSGKPVTGSTSRGWSARGPRPARTRSASVRDRLCPRSRANRLTTECTSSGRSPVVRTSASSSRITVQGRPDRLRVAGFLDSADEPQHPDRRRLAVRQRTPPHRPRRRLRRAQRRLQPLPADGGQPGPHGQRDRRARHADPGAGRQGGRHRPPARRPLQPGHRRGPAGARARVRPVHPHDDPQPLRGRAGPVQGALRQRLHHRAVPAVRDRPVTGRGLPDRYVEGTCPICGYDGARGDQCDNCGNQLDPQDLINPRSKIDGKAPTFVESAQFFLELPAFAQALGGWLQTRQDWRPNVLKFSQNLIEELKPRAITRDLDWGVPIPLPGWSRPRRQADLRLVRRGHRLPVGLASSGPGAPATRRPGGRSGRAPTPTGVLLHGQGQRRLPLGHLAEHPARRERQAGRAARGVRRAGAAQRGGQQRVPHHGGPASSARSRSVVIYVRDVLERYGADPLRYYLAAAGPETSDTDFTWDQFVTRNNSELVAGWGNLVNRTLSMVAEERRQHPGAGRADRAGPAALAASAPAFDTGRRAAGPSQQKAALAEVMKTVGEANKYLSDQAPWKLKDDPARRDTVLHAALQLVDDAKTLLTPFLPHSSRAGAPDARRRRRPGAASRSCARSRTSTAARRYPVLMGDYETEAVWETPAAEGRAPGRAADPAVPQARPVGGRRGAGPAGGRGAVSRATRIGAATARRRPPPSRCRSAGRSTATATWTSWGRRRGPAGRRRSGRRHAGCRSGSTWRRRWCADLAAAHEHVHAAWRSTPTRRPGAATDEALAEIERLAGLPHVVAVGETGLDHYRTGPDGHRRQEQSFRAHIDIAKRTGTALVIHDRDAHADVVRVLDRRARPSGWSSTASAATPGWPGCAPTGAGPCFAGTADLQDAHDELRAAAARCSAGPAAGGDRRAVPHADAVPGGPNASYLVPLTVRALAEVKAWSWTSCATALRSTAGALFALCEAGHNVTRLRRARTSGVRPPTEGCLAASLNGGRRPHPAVTSRPAGPVTVA